MKFSSIAIGLWYNFRHCGYTEWSVTPRVEYGSAVGPGSYLQVSNGHEVFLCLDNCCISSVVSTGSAVKMSIWFALKRT